LPPTTGGLKGGGHCHTHTKYKPRVEKEDTDLFLGGCCGWYKSRNRGDAFVKGRDNVKRLVLEVELGR